MGHLTLISEDVISSLSRFTSSDITLLMPSIPSGWNAYVEGKYEETKKRDAISLGGGKPVVSAGTAGRWKVDEAEPNTLTLEDKTEGEFKRTGKLTRESSADFGPPMDDFDDDEVILICAVNRGCQTERGTSQFLQNSGSDDDEDGGGWLSRSSPFTLKSPPGVGARQDNQSGSSRKPLSSGFDVSNLGASQRHALKDSQDAFGSNSPTSHSIDLGFSSPADEVSITLLSATHV